MIEIKRTMTVSELLSAVIYEFDRDQQGTYAQEMDSSISESVAFNALMVRIRSNKTLSLVKAVRKITGWDLKTSKRFIDNARDYQPQTLESALMLGINEPPF